MKKFAVYWSYETGGTLRADSHPQFCKVAKICDNNISSDGCPCSACVKCWTDFQRCRYGAHSNLHRD